MNCADFKDRLEDELNASNRPQAADLAEHAAQCAMCRATWEGHRLLADSIVAWRRETPDVDLAPAVVFALSQSAFAELAGVQNGGDRLNSGKFSCRHESAPHAKRRVRRSLRVAIGGGVALLVAAALLPVQWRGRKVDTPVARGPSGKGNAAVSEIERSVTPPANEPNADNAGSAAQVAMHQPPQSQPHGSESDSGPYYDLAERAAGALGQMTLLVLPGAATGQNPGQKTGQKTGQEPPAEAPSGWIDDVERELKPVGRSLGNAFDFLWQAGASAEG